MEKILAALPLTQQLTFGLHALLIDSLGIFWTLGTGLKCFENGKFKRIISVILISLNHTIQG